MKLQILCLCPSILESVCAIEKPCWHWGGSKIVPPLVNSDTPSSTNPKVQPFLIEHTGSHDVVWESMDSVGKPISGFALSPEAHTSGCWSSIVISHSDPDRGEVRTANRFFEAVGGSCSGTSRPSSFIMSSQGVSAFSSTGDLGTHGFEGPV